MLTDSRCPRPETSYRPIAIASVARPIVASRHTALTPRTSRTHGARRSIRGERRSVD
jgi:hypothetical protein